MRVWFDTEFIDDGRTIDLISIGLIAENDRVFYAELMTPQDVEDKGNEWVKENVLPHMRGNFLPRSRAREMIIEFVGDKPQFWGYFADYDWVALCQLFGRMIDLPEGWPMYCRDVKQLADSLGNPDLPVQDGPEHHALADAIWTRNAWNFLVRRYNREAA